MEAALGPTRQIARSGLLALALGLLAPAAGALPLEQDLAEATAEVAAPALAPIPPRASPHVRSALVASHLDRRAERAARAAKAAPPPAARIARERVRISFDGIQPPPVRLDVGIMTAVADDLLVPPANFLLPREDMHGEVIGRGKNIVAH